MDLLMSTLSVTYLSSGILARTLDIGSPENGTVVTAGFISAVIPNPFTIPALSCPLVITLPSPVIRLEYPSALAST